MSSQAVYSVLLHKDQGYSWNAPVSSSRFNTLNRVDVIVRELADI